MVGQYDIDSVVLFFKFVVKQVVALAAGISFIGISPIAGLDLSCPQFYCIEFVLFEFVATDTIILTVFDRYTGPVFIKLISNDARFPAIAAPDAIVTFFYDIIPDIIFTESDFYAIGWGKTKISLDGTYISEYPYQLPRVARPLTTSDFPPRMMLPSHAGATWNQNYLLGYKDAGATPKRQQ